MNTNSGQFDNVFDIGAARTIKEKTGKGQAVRKATPESPSEEKHIQSALEVHKKPEAPKKSIYERTMTYLGLME